MGNTKKQKGGQIDAGGACVYEVRLLVPGVV